MYTFYLLCISVTLWTCVSCYPTGAPLNGYGCHGHVRHYKEGSSTEIYPPQYTTSPYKILVNTTHVHKGDIVEGNNFVECNSPFKATVNTVCLFLRQAFVESNCIL